MNHRTKNTVFSIICAAVWLALPAAAQADDESPLRRADDAYSMLEYKSCLENVEQALQLPATKAERATAYRLMGLCHAAEGNVEETTDAFVLLLAIDPNATLEDGLSPRFTSSFLEAKGQWVGKTAFEVTFAEDKIDRNVRSIKIKVTDRPGLMATVAWRDADGELGDALSVADQMLLEVPKNLAKELVFFDEHEGEVFVLALPEIEAKTTKLKEATKADDKPIADDAADVAEDEGGAGLWGFVGVGAVAGVVIVAVVAAGALVGVGIATGTIGEPSSVTAKSGIAFSE